MFTQYSKGNWIFGEGNVDSFIRILLKDMRQKPEQRKNLKKNYLNSI